MHLIFLIILFVAASGKMGAALVKGVITLIFGLLLLLIADAIV